MKLKIQNLQGKVVDSLDVRDDVFGLPPNSALVHQVVVAHLANGRQGTSDTKKRDEVSGGGIKPRPQKHSGRSRQGSTRAPQWRHGGIVFGPHPRDYRQDTPKRMRRQALATSLSEKARADALVVVDSLALEATKTKEMAKALSALKASASVLIVADGAGSAVLRTVRNIPSVDTLPAYQLNAYDVMRHKKLVMTVDAVRKAEALLSAPPNRGKAQTAAAGEAKQA